MYKAELMRHTNFEMFRVKKKVSQSFQRLVRFSLWVSWEELFTSIFRFILSKVHVNKKHKLLRCSQFNCSIITQIVCPKRYTSIPWNPTVYHHFIHQSGSLYLSDKFGEMQKDSKRLQILFRFYQFFHKFQEALTLLSLSLSVFQIFQILSELLFSEAQQFSPQGFHLLPRRSKKRSEKRAKNRQNLIVCQR